MSVAIAKKQGTIGAETSYEHKAGRMIDSSSSTTGTKSSAAQNQNKTT